MSVASHPLDPNSHDLDATPAPDAAAIEVVPSSTGLWLLLLLLGATFLGWYYYGKRPPAPPPAPAMPLVIVPPIERNSLAEAVPAATARKTAVAAAAVEAAAKPEVTAKIDTPRVTQALPLAADNAAPRYPAGALRRGEGGTVVLRVNVGADGKPEDVEVARHSGSRELDRAALVAVRDWRFRPATRDGREVASVVEQPVEFKPRQ
ncbi:tonB family C-terminal domain protein [Lysobacter antibioticus]|uniref:energy transducer TonB n=1 Tax=Lysobacter antibioticus TaxID=84531 RepID=UPI00071F0A99|nr:energy transducer TonB [Lysobacter antibioticus]ALN65955.1 tonB family C-terminal domain protein [Lysobacter antibioticus]